MFSERLKEVRKANRLTQIDMANKLNVTKQSVANWENNNVMPSIDMLIKISNTFNVSSDFLLGINDRKFIDVSELSLEEVAHIQAIINDIKANR